MASLSDCYPDWENFGGHGIVKKKKKKNNKNKVDAFMNYEGFYPLEGFSNQSATVESQKVKPASNSLNIKYGSPNEYMPSEYNSNTYNQEYNNNSSLQAVNRPLKNNSNNSEQVVNSPKEEINTESNDDLKNEMKMIKEMLSEVIDKLNSRSLEVPESKQPTTHDMILFVIFGLFIIFALEGTAKIVANLAKRGRF